MGQEAGHVGHGDEDDSERDDGEQDAEEGGVLVNAEQVGERRADAPGPAANDEHDEQPHYRHPGDEPPAALGEDQVEEQHEEDQAQEQELRRE